MTPGQLNRALARTGRLLMTQTNLAIETGEYADWEAALSLWQAMDRYHELLGAEIDNFMRRNQIPAPITFQRSQETQ